MRRTRREVLRATAAGGAAAILSGTWLHDARSQPAPPPPPRTRMKLEAFASDAAQVAALKRGVAEMMKRKPSDPKSWFFQAAIHGVQPEAVEAALKDDPDVAKVDQQKFWNRCPHFGALKAPSADFL